MNDASSTLNELHNRASLHKHKKIITALSPARNSISMTVQQHVSEYSKWKYSRLVRSQNKTRWHCMGCWRQCCWVSLGICQFLTATSTAPLLERWPGHDNTGFLRSGNTEDESYDVGNGHSRRFQTRPAVQRIWCFRKDFEAFLLK